MPYLIINYCFKPKYIKINKAAGIINFKAMLKSRARYLLGTNISPRSFKLQPAIKHRNKVFNGIKITEVVKSKKSKNVFPNKVKFCNNPNERAAVTAITEIMQNKIAQAFVLVIWKRSINTETGASTMLIPEVIAADSNNTKKATEIMFPKGI